MSFLMIMLTTSVVMSVMMLVLLGLSSLSRKVLNAHTRYIMWVILLVGLIIPFRPLLGEGIIRLDDPTYEGSQSGKQVGDAARLIEGSVGANEGAESSAGTAEALRKPIEIQNSEDAKQPSISIWTIVFILWAAGFIFSLAKYLVQYRNFQRIVKRWAKEVDDVYTLESFEFVKAKMGLEDKKIGLLMVGTLSTPMLTGLFKPVILLPDKPIADDEMELILEHELTHYKHRDLWVNLIAVIALSLHWFNPILYLCLPAIYGDGESYCDETVLKNKNKDYRRFYGEVIISMIEASPQKHIALSTCFYAKKLNIKKRLYTIMEGSAKKRSISLLSIGLALSLTLVSGSVIVFGAPAKEGSPGPKNEMRAQNEVMDEAGLITLEAAKRIALRDAKLKLDEAHFVRVELREDGRTYDVEFYGASYEFDYEIDARSGGILKQDRDIEGFSLEDTKPTEDNVNNRATDNEAIRNNNTAIDNKATINHKTSKDNRVTEDTKAASDTKEQGLDKTKSDKSKSDETKAEKTRSDEAKTKEPKTGITNETRDGNDDGDASDDDDGDEAHDDDKDADEEDD